MMTTSQDVHCAVADWLAGLLVAPPNVDVVAQYRNAGGDALLEAIGNELSCGEAIDLMRAALASGATAQATALDLSVTYTRLFEGLAGPAVAPLYESAYASPDGRLFGQATDEMAGLLQRFGMAVAKGCGEPPDHLSAELELYSTLYRNGNTEGAALLGARLRQWVPEFVDRCRKADPVGFYGAVAFVLSALLCLPAPQRAAFHAEVRP